jgi:O-antigen/teichoic acid export membrane protein
MHRSQMAKNRGVLITEHLMTDLGRRTAWGGAIAIGAQLTRFALQLVSSAIMARLLAPADFGLVAMAAAITGFVGIFADCGLSVATVQRKELDQDTVSALFFLNLGVGILIMALAIIAAPVAAWGFGDERVQWVVIALAPQIILGAAGAQHSALLQRGMRWLTIQWTGIAAQIGSALVAIILALCTKAGYWALVAQGLSGVCISLVLLWTVCPWRPSLVGRWSEVPSALAFGLNLTGFNLVNYFHRQFDNVLIGWRWGPSELGFYTLAYTLLTLPLSLVNGPIGSAVLPALCRVQGDAPRWRKTFLESLGAATLISSGFTAMLIATAAPLVTLIYGSSWSETATIFQFLAISMFAAIPANTMGWIYISLGRTKRMFHWSLMSTPAIVAGFFVGLPFGAAGLALAYSIVMWLILIPCLAVAAHRSPVSVAAMLRVIMGPTALGIVSTLVGLALAPRRGLLEIGGATGAIYFIGAFAILMLDPGFLPLKTRTTGWVSASLTVISKTVNNRFAG